jgi:hypothetical protein
MHFDAITRYGYRPEHAVHIDMRIVIVNLIRSNWTVEYIQSDESECAVILLTINSDIHSIHESHVGSV